MKGNTMKVLDEGKSGLLWKDLEKLCSNDECGAKVLVEEKDVKRDSEDYDFFVSCCVCGSSIIISDSDVPFKLKQKLYGKSH
jgi:hypothetical protein